MQPVRRRQDLPAPAVVPDVVSSRIQNDLEKRFLGCLVLGDDDVTLLLEHPRDAVALSEVSAELRKQVTNLGKRPIAVVGQSLQVDRDAPGTVSLVRDLLV